MKISKKTLFNIHGWLGINLGMLLFVICFSGSFATLSNEIDWLLDPNVRIKSKEAPFDWDAMLASVKKAFPTSRVTSLAEQKNSFTEVGDYFAATAFIQTPNHQIRKVHLNPYTGEIQGHNSFFDVQRFFRNYHSFFFDGNFGGTLIVTFFSFFLFLSALTGFLFYKSWLKNILQLRFKKGLKVFFTDVHRQFGIWSLLFTLIIALTGIFYFAEDVLGMAGKFDILVPDRPKKITETELAKFGPNPKLLPLNTYVENAKDAFPELNAEQIRIPSRPKDYVYIDGQDNNPFTRDRANKVYLHPFTGKVVHIQKTKDLSFWELVTDVVDPPHFGTFGGLTVKIIWFLFGLTLSFSILAGTYIWYVKKANRLASKIRRRKRETVKSNKRWFTQWIHKFRALPNMFKGALFSTVITLLYLIVTGSLIITDGIKSLGPLPVERMKTIHTGSIGPWNLELNCEYPCRIEGGAKFHANFKTQGIPNYQKLELMLISERDSSLRIPFKGPSAKPSLTLPKEIRKPHKNQYKLAISSLSGETFTASIDEKNIVEAANYMASRFLDHPSRSYPEVPKSVYVFILSFFLMTILILGVWTYYIIKVGFFRYRASI
ncbi:MAG: PepSY-associated TM helix domain-containing protein [Bacteroidota bacterium]